MPTAYLFSSFYAFCARPVESISGLFFSLLETVAFFFSRYEALIESICRYADSTQPIWKDRSQVVTSLIASSHGITFAFYHKQLQPLIDLLSCHYRPTVDFIVDKSRRSYGKRQCRKIRSNFRAVVNTSSVLNLGSLILSCVIALFRFISAIMLDPFLLCIVLAVLSPLVYLAWDPFLEAITLSAIKGLWHWRSHVWFSFWVLSLLGSCWHLVVAAERTRHSFCGATWTGADLSVGAFFHLECGNARRPTTEAIRALHASPIPRRWWGRLTAQKTVNPPSIYTPWCRSWSSFPLPVLRTGHQRLSRSD